MRSVVDSRTTVVPGDLTRSHGNELDLWKSDEEARGKGKGKEGGSELDGSFVSRTHDRELTLERVREFQTFRTGSSSSTTGGVHVGC